MAGWIENGEEMDENELADIAWHQEEMAALSALPNPQEDTCISRFSSMQTTQQVLVAGSVAHPGAGGHRTILGRLLGHLLIGGLSSGL